MTDRPITWRRRWRWFRRGLWFGYPVCCVVRFTLARQEYQGLRRGGRDNGPDLRPVPGQLEACSVHVPCGVFHRHDPDRPPHPDYTRPRHPRRNR